MSAPRKWSSAKPESIVEVEFEGQPSGEVFAWMAFYCLLLLALLAWGILQRACAPADLRDAAAQTEDLP